MISPKNAPQKADAERDVAPHARPAQGVGQHVEETALADFAVAAEVVGPADRSGVVGREDGALGHVGGVDDVEQVVAAADHRHAAGLQRLEDARQRGAVARAVNPARPHDRPVSAVGATQLLRPDLGPAVVIAEPEALAERFVLGEQVGPFARMAVDRDRADVQETADASVAAGVENALGRLDDPFAESTPRPPFADAGGAMVDHVGACHGPPYRIGIGQIAHG